MPEDRTAGTGRGSPADDIADLRELVIGYAKQETIDPLKALKNYVQWGSIGSLFVGIGCAFLMLGVLRGLQTINFFNDPQQPHGGTWSFLPYVITVALGIVMIALSLWRAKQAYDRSRARQEQA